MLVQKDRDGGSRGLALKTHTFGGHKGWMWMVCLAVVDQTHRALYSSVADCLPIFMNPRFNPSAEEKRGGERGGRKEEERKGKKERRKKR